MRFLSVVFCAALMSFSVKTADAGVITQSVNVGGGTPSLTTDLNNVDFSGPLGLFNVVASGYVVHLDSVNIILNTYLSINGTLTNKASQKQKFKFSESVESYVDAGNADVAAVDAQQVIVGLFGFGTTGDVSQGFGTRSYNLLSGASANYPSSSGTSFLSASAEATLTDKNSLAAFYGSGSFGLNFNTLTSQSFSGGGGNIRTDLNTRAGSVMTVKYSYSLVTVPEPTSLIIVMTSIVALSLLRGRIHSR